MPQKKDLTWSWEAEEKVNREGFQEEMRPKVCAECRRMCFSKGTHTQGEDKGSELGSEEREHKVV